jgi:hypothetical protein
LQKDEVEGWSVGAAWGSTHLHAFSTFQQLNQIMVCVVCSFFFFQFALRFVALNAFSKVDPTYGACASTSLINFWFMFTYDL